MKTLNINTKLDFYQNILVNSIDLESYDINNDVSLYDKIKTVYNIFKQEYLFPANLKRYGNEVNCFKEWLQGLPSVLTVPFYNYEILELGKNNGALNTGASEARENIFLEKYWVNLAHSFFILKNKL